MNSIDQQFIEYIVKSLVGNPDAVKIERRIDEKGVLLELSVDPDDLGRVIGKRGATAQSLRTLLRALGTKNDARYNLKIIDTGPPPERRQAEPMSDSSGDEQKAPEPVSKPAEKTVEPDLAQDEQVQSAGAPAKPLATTNEADDEIAFGAEDEALPDTASEETSRSDAISRTRKELADLDDLDV